MLELILPLGQVFVGGRQPLPPPLEMAVWRPVEQSGPPPALYGLDAALCVLEMRVHLDLPFSLIPEGYGLITIDLDDLAVERLADVAADPVSIGDSWLAEARTPVLEVASVIIAESTNLRLNPAHLAAGQAKSSSVRAFSLDQRLCSGA